MKANEYINKYGVDCAKEILKHDQYLMNFSFYIDLKRLIESHELVESYVGLEDATKVCIQLYCKGEDISRLKRAIADVESCQ